MRSARVFGEVRATLASASHESFRIIHFSVQNDHIHLLAEADSSDTLSCGVQLLASRTARRVNRVLRRTGALWDDRYHSRALATPREVRSAIVYVLMNWKKHGARGPLAGGPDPCSSAAWLDGWGDCRAVVRNEWPPVRKPQTWLLRIGWRRHGPIRLDERPSEHAR